MRIINANLGCKLMLGRQSENDRTQVVFDFSDIAAEFPGGLVTIVARRPDDTSAHIVDGIVQEGTVARWTVSDYELAQDGTGKVQLIYSVSNAVAKTKNWTTEIGESLTAVEGTPPEWMDMFNRLIQAAGEVHQVTEQMRTWRNETEALRNEAEEYCNRVIESESQVDTWHDEVLRAAIAVSDDKALVKQWRDETEQFDIGAERASYEAAHAEQAALASQVNAAHSEATAIAKATEAAESARIASLKAAEATDGATTVVNKTAQATQAAGTATAKAAEAQTAAQTATSKAYDAAESERIATAKAVEATTAAGTATTKAEQATEAAQTATEKARDASASATAAHASATDAASSATAASASETAAKASETAASTSASQAAQSVLDAGANAQTAMQKAAEATQSATNAAASATNAATSAETASTKAGEAAQSAQAVAETAEQLAESLEQIGQNTQDIAEHEQYAEATYAKKTDLSNLTSDLDLVQTSGTIVETDDAFPTFAENVTAEIVPVQSGSGDPSPENIRPITGFDSVKVSRTGKNLATANMFSVSHDTVMTFSPPIPAGTYSYSYIATRTGSSTDNGAIRFVYDDGTYTQEYLFISTERKTKAITFQKSVASIYVYSISGSYANSGNYTLTCTDFQLELGSTATPYEPYHGIQVELPFGQTVYGGTIDLTTGKLTVDRAMYTANGNETLTQWQLIGTSANIAAVITYIKGSSAYANYADRAMNAMCDRLPQVSNVQMYMKRTDRGVCIMNNKRIALQVDGITTLNEMSAWLAENKPTFVYKLATPLTYTLTPVQVLLLRDYNVLWADTGDIINLEYRAGSFVTKKTYDALKEATLIHNTASGSIASFVDGAEMPVDEVTAQINPVQDLHGYDHPWPAGGGVNVLDFAQYFTEGETVTQNGVTATFSNGYLKVTGTNTTSTFNIIYKACNVVLPAGTYIMPNNLNIRCNIDNQGNNNYAGAITAESSVQMVAFYVFASTNATVNYNIPMMMVKGETRPTTYSPYANICPISGFEGLTVWDTGKNMINPSELVYSAGGNNVWYGIHLPPDTDFVFSTDSIITGLYVAYSDDDEMPSISGTGWDSITYKYNTTSLRFNSGSHKWYRLMTYEINGVIRDRLYQLELGTTATDYEPYQGETYEVSFPSEAGTVYGGELTIAEDGSGVLTVDRATVDLGTLNYGYNAAYKVFSAYKGDIKSHGYCVSSQYKYSDGISAPDMSCCLGYSGWFVNNICIKDSRYSVSADFKAAMSGVQLVYELATPITYQLTAPEITTLLGENNLWHDANGDISVGYKADTKLYIDGKIAELVARIVNS